MRHLRNIFNLGIKELRSLLGDKAMLTLIVFSFTVSVYSSATVTPGSLNLAPIAIADMDQSQLSNRIVNSFYRPWFLPPEMITADEMDAGLDAGRYTFAINIPPNFQRDVLAGRQPDIQVNVDATRMSQAFTGNGYIQNIINGEVNSFVARYRDNSEPLVSLETRMRFNPNLDPAWFGGVMAIINNITMLAIVLTGSAIGSNLGSMFKMEHRTLMLLVGCGAAGAIGGIFKAPIAGLVFTLEVLMIDLTMSSLLPLLISAVTAATVSYITTGQEAMFKFHLDQPFELERIPYVILLGIFCGLVSLYFTRAMNSVEGVFGKLSNPYKKLALGGVMLSVLIFLFPPLYGEGYDTIELLLNGVSNADWDTVLNNSLFYGYGNLLLVYLVLIILLKVFASSATNGGGGCGGIFAPSLYLGCIAGFVFSHFSNDFDFTSTLPEKNFALMGMAGVMSGVMHAPLTGVFLIAELTGGYDLFLPLMIVSVSSYLTIIVFEPHSIYSMRLAKKGQLLTHHKDKAVLTLMKVENVVETDFVSVRPEMDLGELVKAISTSHRNMFPVTDKDGVLLGVVLLDDIRNIMFRQELYHRFTVSKLMTSVPARLYDTDSMEQVMQTFDDTKAWNLPVVNEEGKYLGFVSKSKIFNSYRQVLVHFSED